MARPLDNFSMSQMGASLIEDRTAGILIVGPEDLGKRVADLMAAREYSVQTATADELVQELKVHDYDLVVLDLSGNRQEEDPLVDQVLEVQSWLSVVVMKDGSGESGLESLNQGVYFYLAHPVRSKTLEWVLKKGVERSRLLAENATLRNQTLSDDLTETY